MSGLNKIGGTRLAYLILNRTLNEYPYHSTKYVEYIAIFITPTGQYLSYCFEAGNLL